MIIGNGGPAPEGRNDFYANWCSNQNYTITTMIMGKHQTFIQPTLQFKISQEGKKSHIPKKSVNFQCCLALPH